MTTRLDRQSIISSPQPLVEAKAATKIKLWYVHSYAPNITSSTVFIAFDRDHCSQDRGTPLPDNSHILTLDLKDGQTLWAMTAFQALVGMVIED